MLIENKKYYFLLFIFCLASRIATTIYYIEDTDSLRFALSIGEYDVAKLQPHFPGYPIFCFFAKILFFFTKSLAISFSIIGGVSIFIIIFFLLKICKTDIWTTKGAMLSGLVFLNPLLWLMSNRYMPDLMGLAIVVLAFYFLSTEKFSDKNIMLGFLFTGLVSGVRLSYLPVLLVPVCRHFILSKNKINLFISITAGFLFWLVPFIWVTGFENLFNSAFKQANGHFLDFGGTIITENNWTKRIFVIIRSIWADGLGGYWFGRSLQTLLLSIPMVYIMYSGFKNLKTKKPINLYWILISFICVYGLWIFFFQNVIYKSRHVLPLLVPFILILLQGVMFLIRKDNILNKIIVILFFLSLINVTSVLVVQHKGSSAISRIKDQLIVNNNDQIIASTPLINYYLKYNGVVGKFFDIENENDIHKIIALENDSLYLIGNFKDSFINNYNIVSDSIFFHNPYVNRMWSDIRTFTIAKKYNVR